MLLPFFEKKKVFILYQMIPCLIRDRKRNGCRLLSQMRDVSIMGFTALYISQSVALVLCGLFFLTAKSYCGVTMSCHCLDHHWVLNVSLRLDVCNHCHFWKDLAKYVLKGLKAFILNYILLFTQLWIWVTESVFRLILTDVISETILFLNHVLLSLL